MRIVVNKHWRVYLDFGRAGSVSLQLWHTSNRTTRKDPTIVTIVCFCLFVCFVALRPKSTAMVIAGRSVHLTTFFPGQA